MSTDRSQCNDRCWGEPCVHIYSGNKDLTPARVADFNRRYDASHPPAVAPPSSRSAGPTRREWAQIVVAPLLILVMFVVAMVVAK